MNARKRQGPQGGGPRRDAELLWKPNPTPTVHVRQRHRVPILDDCEWFAANRHRWYRLRDPIQHEFAEAVPSGALVLVQQLYPGGRIRKAVHVNGNAPLAWLIGTSAGADKPLAQRARQLADGERDGWMPLIEDDDSDWQFLPVMAEVAP